MTENRTPAIVLNVQGGSFLEVHRAFLEKARELLPADFLVLLKHRLHEGFASRVLYKETVSTVRAPLVDFVIEPSDLYRELLAALLAGDIDVIHRFVHGSFLH